MITLRKEDEMFDLILRYARQDSRIRAVILNGSRADPDATQDMFRDFDIVYVVTDVHDFTADHSWIDVFGERIILQMPDTSSLFPAAAGSTFAYLMQFADGNRIDLTLVPVSWVAATAPDSQSILMLDKDGIIPPLPPPSNKDYCVSPPAQKQLSDCCNEFWWVMCYVAKGIWREELPYAMGMFNGPVRDELDRMLGWYIGVEHHFAVSVGKCSKYFQRFLALSWWSRYRATYAAGDYASVWAALFVACDLFVDASHSVAAACHFTYPLADETRVLYHLAHIRHLPRDAKEIY